MAKVQMIDHSITRYLSIETDLIPRSGEYIQLNGNETFRVDYVYYPTQKFEDSTVEEGLVTKHKPDYDAILYGEVVDSIPF